MLTNDWLAATERGVEFPDGHTEQLLYENNNFRNPLPLVKSFTGGLRYCERLKTLTEYWKLQGGYFGAEPKKRLSESRMIKLIDEYCSVLVKFGERRGKTDSVNNLKSAQIRFEPDPEAFGAITNPSADTPWSPLVTYLSDFYIDKIFAKDARLISLDEATLQLTKRNEVTMWVMETLVQTGLDFRPGYEIITGGGRMAVLDHEIIYRILSA